MKDDLMLEFTKWYIEEYDELPDLECSDDKIKFDVFRAGYRAGSRTKN